MPLKATAAQIAVQSATPPELRIQIRSHSGDYVRTVHQSAADDLVKHSLGEWASFGRNRFVRLAESLSNGWQGGNKTTRRAKGEWGQYIGAPRATQEHRP